MDQADLVVSPRVELRLLDEALFTAFIERRIDKAARLLEAELEPQWPDAHDDAFLRTRLDDRARDGGAGPWGHARWYGGRRRAE